MPIRSSDIPQADNLEDVVRTVESVSDGARSFQDIAAAIEKVERQGRYYRKAAEILGLITTVRKNHSLLTPLGRRFIRGNQETKNRILLQAVLEADIIRRLIPYFELHPEGLTRDGIVEFLEQLSPHLGDSMLPRRISTILSWLTSINIINKENERYYLGENTNQINLLEFANHNEPIIPVFGNLNEYNTVQQRTTNAQASILIQRNQIAVERANNTHKSLVDLVAARIRNAGAIPRSNQLIDLATRYNNQSYIFEMKSTTQKNVRDQIRKGMSQLYEYRYLQNNPGATLVLVLDRPLSENVAWMNDYLHTDRQVKLVWDGNNNLFSTDNTRNELVFLF